MISFKVFPGHLSFFSSSHFGVFLVCIGPQHNPQRSFVLPALLARLVASVLDGPGVLPLPTPEVVPTDSPAVPDEHNSRDCIMY
jgi:hypothetical protein